MVISVKQRIFIFTLGLLTLLVMRLPHMVYNSELQHQRSLRVQDHTHFDECAFGMVFWDKAAFDHGVLMNDDAYCHCVLETAGSVSISRWQPAVTMQR